MPLRPVDAIPTTGKPWSHYRSLSSQLRVLRLHIGELGVGEQPRAGVEGLAGVALEREGTAVARDHVDDQLRVLPVFVLRGADVEGHAADVPEVHVVGADGEVGGQVAIRGTVVAA